MKELAIVKALDKKAKDVQLEPGRYVIDETISVHVYGELNKFKDEEYTPTADIPLKLALALVLKKAGFQRDKCKEILVSAMKEAIECQTKGEDEIAERMGDIDDCMKHVQDIIGELPKKTKKGKTTHKLNFEFIA